MRTHRGVVRENNEDAVGGELSAGLVVLADGMGGANAGEVASHLAVEMLVNELVIARESGLDDPDRTELQDAMHRVNQAILELAQNVPEYRGMGTTLITGLFQQDRLIFAHVGDSRLYRFRQGVLEPLTRDHTLIHELVELGEFESVDQALLAGVSQNILSRAIGSEAEVLVDIDESAISAGDLFLFCSDGLTSMVPDREIEQILDHTDSDLMGRADALIDKACINGGTDNVSVILAGIDDNDNRNNKGEQ
ncbi:MAG: protein phosphatase 2C domain-containing protein [Gammaproteobacteria bacterium]|nr:protein phosphatase 2C domain-containing protein [Gammaproteobacteria bacterium]